jgi:hypothetical protein
MSKLSVRTGKHSVTAMQGAHAGLSLLASLSDEEDSPVAKFPRLTELHSSPSEHYFSSSPSERCGECSFDDDGSSNDDELEFQMPGPARQSATKPSGDSSGSAQRAAANTHFARAYARGKSHAAASDTPSSSVPSSSRLSSRGGRPSREDLDRRRASAVNDALQGQDHKGRTHTYARCKHPVGQSPCCFNLWANDAGSTGKDELEAHTREWLTYSERERKHRLTEQLKGAFDSKLEKWTYLVNGRAVCRSVFLLFYPISPGTLTNIQDAIRHPGEGHGGIRCEEDRPLGNEKVATAVAGWLLGYCEEVGDRVGCLAEGNDADTLIIPRVEKHQIWLEYKAGEGEDAATEAYFMRVWRSHPELQHIEMARKVRNFQLCASCHRISEGITRAHKGRLS